MDAKAAHSGGGRRPNAVELRDRQTLGEGRSHLGSDHEHAVGLTLIGGQFCEELVVRHACRGGEACVGPDLGPDLLGNGRGVGNALQVLGHVEVSLIKTPVIGYLGGTTEAAQNAALLPAFRRGLAEAGLVEGRNVAVDFLWAEGRYERLPALAARLVERRADIIVAAGGTVAALAAKAATATIPTVVLSGDDPVVHGLAAAINRPGGNITGVVQLVLASEGKRLEVLRELVPQADRIAVLFNPTSPNIDRQRRSVQAAADALGVRLQFVSVSDDAGLDRAMAEAAGGSKALLVAGDPYFLMRS